MLFVSLTLLSNVIAFILASHGTNNMLVYNVYSLLSHWILSFLFIAILGKSSVRFIIVAAIGVTIACFYDWFLADGMFRLSFWPYLLFHLVLILFSLWYFLITLQRSTEYDIQKQPDFLISSAILFYNATSFFVSVFSEFTLSELVEGEFDFWIINLVANIIFHIILSIALWIPSPKKSI